MHDSLLAGFLGSIDRKYVVVLGNSFNDSFYKSREVNHVNGWDSIVTLPDEGKLCWSLQPCFLEMVVENPLSISI